MNDRPPLWSPGYYALLWVAVGLLLWSCLFAVSTALGQEVIHYRALAQQTEELVVEYNLLLNSNGEMAVVVRAGPPGSAPRTVAGAGPITESEAGEDGLTAACFNATSIQGLPPEWMGRRSCFVITPEWAYETGEALWGEATSPELERCTDASHDPPRNPNERST